MANPYNEIGLWLKQSDAIVYSGKSQGTFLSKIKPKLLSKKNERGRIFYFLPKKMMDKFHQEEFCQDATYPYPERSKSEDEILVDEIIGDVTSDPITVETGDSSIDIVEARRQEILTRTKYLNQKIIDQKHQIFAEWSERFFEVFSKSFSKFKNSLIELHLNESQLNLLNENLDLALQNLENTLAEIENEYLNDDEENEDGN